MTAPPLVGLCRLERVGGLDKGREAVGWCYVCVRCESGIICVDGRSRYLCTVLGGYLHI